MATATFRVWRGEHGTGAFRDFETEVSEGMVVLDALHDIQAEQANDLAIRWNCKAGKCGSCSAEVNGIPRLTCMTRLSDIALDRPVTVEPMKAFPHVKDLVTDVSWNYAVKRRIKPFRPREPDHPDGTWRMQQVDIDRVQEFRKCIECFLCQDICHVLRDHHLRVVRQLAVPVLAGAVQRQHRRVEARALLRPMSRRSLPIGIDQHRVLAVDREMRREIGRQRGLADAAFGTGHKYRLHADPR